MKTENMFSADDLKLIVKEKYGDIASQSKKQNEYSCCGGTACDESIDYTIFSDDYTKIEGYNADADLGLGCGIPTEFAGISKGDHVLDLGSGAGNDCFVARKEVGDSGKVTGLDFTQEMVDKARENLIKTGFLNVEFILGDIENMPLNSNIIDVIVSNCVLNLVPNKKQAFKEILRVLKPGGHFSISDVVLIGELNEKLQTVAELYAGCVSGAMQKNEYLSLIEDIGFSTIQIMTEKIVNIPDSILSNYLNEEEMKDAKQSDTKIVSITVRAEKPLD